MTFQSFAKRSLYVLNVAVCVVGVVLTALSAILLSKWGDHADSMSRTGLYIALVVGLLTCVGASLGLWATAKSSRPGLLVYCFVLLLICCGALASYVIMLNYVDYLDEYTRQKSAVLKVDDIDANGELTRSSSHQRAINDKQLEIWNSCCAGAFKGTVPGMEPVSETCTAAKGWPCFYEPPQNNGSSSACDFLSKRKMYGSFIVGDPDMFQGCGVYPDPQGWMYYKKFDATRDELLWGFQQALFVWYDEHYKPFTTAVLVFSIAQFCAIVFALCVRTGTDPDDIEADRRASLKNIDVEMASVRQGNPTVSDNNDPNLRDEDDQLAIEDDPSKQAIVMS